MDNQYEQCSSLTSSMSEELLVSLCTDKDKNKLATGTDKDNVTYISSEVPSEKNKKVIDNKPDKKHKKRRKKKRSNIYKDMLRNLKTSSKTEQEKREDYKRRIAQNLGGGNFLKVNRL